MFDNCFQSPLNLMWLFIILLCILLIIKAVKWKSIDSDKPILITLTTLYSVSVVSSVIAATKIIRFDIPLFSLLFSDGMYVPAGVIIYASSFLITDLISEVYGKNEAFFAVKLGFISMLIFTGYSLLMVEWEPAHYWLNQESYETVVNSSIRITIGGFVSFILSQFLDVKIFHLLKNESDNDSNWVGSSQNLWIRNNVSTITSQFLDSTIFIFIAFYGIYDDIISMIMAQWTIKVLIALLDTPFAYWARKIIVSP